jgi:hypothetical protein
MCLACPAGREPNPAKTGCISCEDGKYSNATTNSVCVICPSKKKPNPNKDGCEICKTGCVTKCSILAENGSCNKNDDCFWLYNESEGEKGSCVEKSDGGLRCDDAKRSNQCPLSDVINLLEKKCVWALNMCYDVKNTCESIRNRDVCQTEGAAVATSEKILNCLWLEENITRNTGARCAIRV